MAGGALGGGDLRRRAADRLLAEHRLAGGGGRRRDLDVQHVGRGHHHHVDGRVVDDAPPVVGGRAEPEVGDGRLAPLRHGVGAHHQLGIGRTVGEQRGDATVAAAVGLAHPAEPDDPDPDRSAPGHRGPAAVVMRAARVDRHRRPRVAHPVVGRVVAERHRALLAGAGHHVEVVQRVARRGHARPVVAAGDHEHVAVGHGDVDLDRLPFGRIVAPRVRAVHGEPLRRVVGAGGPPDAEVVDLLVVRRALGAVVVLVRRVARPVAVGREHLDGRSACRRRRTPPAT